MSEPAWYRSLYWRIAFGFVGFLAVMLLAQGLLFLWLAGRAAGALPARSPVRLAELVASDMAGALQRDPALDVARYVKEQFSHQYEPFLVLMTDGRTVVSRPFETADLIAQNARRRLVRERIGFGRGPGPPGRRFEEFRRGDAPPSGQASPGGQTRPGEQTRPAPDERTPRRPGPFGMRGPMMRGGGQSARPLGPDMLGGVPPRLAEFAVIRVNNEVAGIVAVATGRQPLELLLRELGPTMAGVAIVLLIVGTALVAVVVFRPARKRLAALEAATTRLGAGDMGVRAPEAGGDEVSRLARSFNRMAADLETRARELRASDKARRQLLADVSHELMTPLTAMRGYLETLGMSELQLDGATRERYLHIVDEESLRLEHIIGDLLDLARLEGGGGNPVLERVPVQHLFDRVAKRHGRRLQERDVTLGTRIGPGAEMVRGDADRLEQALQNLAANALRHTPAGGHITLEAAPRAGRVVLSVRDTGPGIPAEHLPLIFDRFYKVGAARESDDGSGSGLGLSIVKAIVERHGGTITASTPEGGGALFEITLDSASSAPASTPPIAAHAGDLQQHD